MRHISLILMSCLILTGCTSEAHRQEIVNRGLDPRYVIQSDTVYDKNTGLTWQRCSVGQRWVEGSGCVGEVKTMSFDEAQKQDYGSWRVPSQDELITLIDGTRGAYEIKPTIDVIAFPNMDLQKLSYWTNRASGHRWFTNEPLASAVYFDASPVGAAGGAPKSSAFAVRLVRSN